MKTLPKTQTKPHRKPPHITQPYERPDGEPDGFRMPQPEPSRASRAIKYAKGPDLGNNADDAEDSHA